MHEGNGIHGGHEILCSYLGLGREEKGTVRLERSFHGRALPFGGVSSW
jgi:hypothetical protein